MQPILIQGAMKVEMGTYLDHMEKKEELLIGQWPFVCGVFQGIPLIICQTEWGMANAAACTALAMERFHPAAVISQGTAGGHDPELNVFDIVVAERTVNESAWQTRYAAPGEGVDYRALKKLGVFAYDHQQQKFTQEVYHACDSGWVQAAMDAQAVYRRGRVVRGTVGTCDSWNCEADRVLFLHEFYGSSCEEMESDAVAQICQTYAVPFLSIRVISNTVFDGDTDWDLSVGPALQTYVLAVIAAHQVKS